jgi:transcriptional regulator with XRE-family HTH domain
MDGGQAERRSHLLVLGAHLRSLRQDRGLSQMALGEAAGLDRAFIGFIERGERDFGVSHLWPLAAALGVDLRDLIPSTQKGTVAK